MRDSGGVVGVCFHHEDVGPQRTDIARHVDYIADRLGPEHVALGSDFDGCELPEGMRGAQDLPLVLDDLRASAGGSPSCGSSRTRTSCACYPPTPRPTPSPSTPHQRPPQSSAVRRSPSTSAPRRAERDERENGAPRWRVALEQEPQIAQPTIVATSAR